jgi:DNA-binding NarL/FixJ family response regulator
VKGYVAKADAATKLLDAIDAVLAGGTYFASPALRIMARAGTPLTAHECRGVDRLPVSALARLFAVSRSRLYHSGYQIHG